MNKYRLLLVKEGVYVGEIKNGKPHGKGILKYTNSKYVGEFKDGKCNGQGILTSKFLYMKENGRITMFMEKVS